MTLNQVSISPVFPLWLIFLLLFFGLAAAVYQYWRHSEETGESQSRSPISSSPVRSFPSDLFRPESLALGKEGTEGLSVPRHPLRYLSKHGSFRGCRKRE